MAQSYRNIIIDIYNIPDLRTRLIGLITNDPTPVYKISSAIGLSHTTFLDFIDGRRIPQRSSVAKIKEYIENKEKELEKLP